MSIIDMWMEIEAVMPASGYPLLMMMMNRLIVGDSSMHAC